jgi:hypothetical protein
MNIQNFEGLFSKIPNIFLSLPPSLSLAPCLCVYHQQEEKKKKEKREGSKNPPNKLKKKK